MNQNKIYPKFFEKNKEQLKKQYDVFICLFLSVKNSNKKNVMVWDGGGGIGK